MDVRTYIDGLDITVSKAAELSGVNRSILVRVLNGQRRASYDVMRKLVRWSNGEIDYASFFETDDEEEAA